MKRLFTALGLLLLAALLVGPALADSPISGLQSGGLVNPLDVFPDYDPTHPGTNFGVTFGSAAAASLGTSGASLGLLNTVNTYSAVQNFLSGDLNAADPVFTGGSIQLPSGNSGARPSSPINGMLRYNNATPGFEGYVAGSWGPIGGAGSSFSLTSTGPGLVLGTSPWTGGTTTISLGAPGVSTFGGILGSSGASANQFMTYIDTSGVQHTAQVNFSNLAGTASNAQIPAPTTVGLGGLLAQATATANQIVQYIDTSGVQHLVQLAFSNISGTLTNAQLPTSGVSAGSYTSANLTVNAQGIVTVAANGSGGGAVSSVFGRTGIVAATSGDYSVAQITGAAPLASPTFTGTVGLPAGQVVNGVTLTTGNSATTYLNGAGNYTTPAGGGGLTVGTTTITSGVSGKIEYDNAGVLGELSVSGTGTTVPLTVSPTFTGTVSVAALTASGVVTELNSVATGTGADTIPVGTTGQRPGSPVAGMIRQNSTLGDVEAYFNSAWNALVSALSSNSPDIVVTCTGGSCVVTSTTPINNQSGSTSYTVVSTDMGKLIIFNSGSAVSVALAQAGTTGFGLGSTFQAISLGAGTVTITPTTSTINTASTLTLGTNQSAQITSDGTNYEALLGKSSGSGGVTALTGDGTLINNSGSTGSVTVTLANAGANTVWGNNTGSSAAPGYTSAPVLGTSLTSPNIIGGTAVSSVLTLESTSGSGTSDSVVIKTGSQITAITFDTHQTTTLSGAGRAAQNTPSLSTSTFTANFNVANHFDLALVHASCPCTVANPSNITAGQSGIIEIDQSSTGGDTVSWGSDFKFAGATAPTLSTGASAQDYFSYYVKDSTHIIISSGVLNAH